MAWSVDDIYRFTRFLCNKNQAGGISATDLFYAWNGEQASYHEDLLGRWQARAADKTGPNIGMIQDETVLLKLAPFTILVNIPIVSGYAPWPSDFIYGAALRINGQKVYHFNKDERWSIEEDVIDPPSIAENSYYYTEYDKKFLILPTNAPSIDLDYIASPQDIQWAYTLDGNNRQIYNPATSIQPKWTANTIIEITKRTLKGFGLHFSDKSFEEFGNSNIITGN